jgi:glycosyltransferase involved in cell wall biosynthesis
MVVPRIIKKTRRIITVSAHEKQLIIHRLNVPADKVVVIHNGLKKDFGKGQTSIESFCNKYKLPSKYFLFLGNTIERKNAVRAIQAHIDYLSKSKNKIPLVAPGLSENFVRKAHDELGISFDSKLYNFPGYIPEPDLPYLFKFSFCFLFPSIREGFGLPIIEAMSAGVPVITSSTSSMPEVADTAALLVDPYSVMEISNAMIKIESDETLRSQLIKKGLARCLHFSWEANASQTLSLYQNAKLSK